MASSDATPFPIKNQAYRVTFPIFDADGDLVTGAAGLDSEVSKDGGTFADCTNEATEIATASGMYYLDLSSTEMNADTVAIIVKTSTSGAKTTPIVLYPITNGLDIPVNATYLGGTAQTPRDIGASVLLSSGTGTGQLSFTSGILKVDLDTIKTNPVVNAGTVTFPTGATLASTTNITAGTITTATNLTNAPTAGDFTATMKTSIGTAVAASAVASVTGNVGGNVTGSVGSVASGGITVTSIAADAIGASELAADAVAEIAGAVWDITLSSHLTGGSTGNALNAAGAAGDPWTTSLPGAYTAGSAGYIVGTNVNAAISSRLATAGYTAPLDAAGTRSAIGMAAANLDTQLAALAAYVDTEVAAIKAKTDNLPTDPADASEIAGLIAAVSVLVSAIKTKTDQLTFSTGSTLASDVVYVNGVEVVGTGASGDEWGPA